MSWTDETNRISAPLIEIGYEDPERDEATRSEIQTLLSILADLIKKTGESQCQD